MTRSRTYNLPLLDGMQVIRLGEDSLDYGWNGLGSRFHGTLPYENLRMRTRVMRKSRGIELATLILGLMILSLARFLPDWLVQAFGGFTGPVFAAMVAGCIVQVIAGGRICVQIEPRPFGFGGELPVPDTRKGRAFLDDLECAWNESLRGRFLARNKGTAEQWLQQINWLQFVGVLTSEQAEAERLLIKVDAKSDERESEKEIALN